MNKTNTLLLDDGIFGEDKRPSRGSLVVLQVQVLIENVI